MKLIVAGSRSIRDKQTVRYAIEDADLIFGPVDRIIHGGARGVDSLADDIARAKGFKVTVFEAEWDKYGKAAGPVRNRHMAKEADALVAIWDGESPGTKDMMEKAVNYGLDVLVIQPN